MLLPLYSTNLMNQGSIPLLAAGVILVAVSLHVEVETFVPQVLVPQGYHCLVLRLTYSTSTPPTLNLNSVDNYNTYLLQPLLSHSSLVPPRWRFNRLSERSCCS